MKQLLFVLFSYINSLNSLAASTDLVVAPQMPEIHFDIEEKEIMCSVCFEDFKHFDGALSRLPHDHAAPISKFCSGKCIGEDKNLCQGCYSTWQKNGCPFCRAPFQNDQQVNQFVQQLKSENADWAELLTKPIPGSEEGLPTRFFVVVSKGAKPFKFELFIEKYFFPFKLSQDRWFPIEHLPIAFKYKKKGMKLMQARAKDNWNDQLTIANEEATVIATLEHNFLGTRYRLKDANSNLIIEQKFKQQKNLLKKKSLIRETEFDLYDDAGGIILTAKHEPPMWHPLSTIPINYYGRVLTKSRKNIRIVKAGTSELLIQIGKIGTNSKEGIQVYTIDADLTTLSVREIFGVFIAVVRPKGPGI